MISVPPKGATVGAQLVTQENTVGFVFAGWQFIQGGGDPQAVAQARNKLLYAAIGIVVAVLARGIVTAVKSLVVG